MTYLIPATPSTTQRDKATKELSVFKAQRMRNLSVILFTSILMHFFYPMNILWNGSKPKLNNTSA